MACNAKSFPWPLYDPDGESCILKKVDLQPEDGAILYPEAEAQETAKRWHSCLAARVPGLQPHLPSLQDFLLWKWGIDGHIDLIPMSGGEFLIQISSPDEMERVFRDGPWFISGKPLLLSHWSPSLNQSSKIARESVPVWVMNHCLAEGLCLF